MTDTTLDKTPLAMVIEYKGHEIESLAQYFEDGDAVDREVAMVLRDLFRQLTEERTKRNTSTPPAGMALVPVGELEALRADAGRYRFLRDSPTFPIRELMTLAPGHWNREIDAAKAPDAGREG